MAGLLVHVAAAAALAQVFRDGRLRAVLYVGACLPDVLRGILGFMSGDSLGIAGPAHSPLGLLPWCFAAALLFEEDWRGRAFGALLGGSWLHLGVDALLGTSGPEGLLPGFPFSSHRLEKGWLPAIDPWILVTASGVMLGVAALRSNRSAVRRS